MNAVVPRAAIQVGGDMVEIGLVASLALPDALMLVTDSLANLNRQRILDYATAQRIPTMFEFANFVQSGGLMSYGGDVAETHKIAADSR